MKNPWTRLPDAPRYVLPEDAPFVAAWNDTRGSDRDQLRLHLDALPEPFCGPRKAPVVVLGRNPGWSGKEPKQHRKSLEAAIRGNLGKDKDQHVQSRLLDRFADTAGGGWTRRCWHRVVEGSGLSFDELATRVLSVEFHGYHSQDWAPLPVTLPSQWYGFQLVGRAVARGAVIVILRGRRDWEVAVPSLRTHPFVFATKTAGNASISPGNLPPGAFDRLIQAVTS
jgi:hypothetical protein